MECLVIDTGSEMAKQYARELKGPADALKLQQWGKLKNGLDNFFSFTNNKCTWDSIISRGKFFIICSIRL